MFAIVFVFCFCFWCFFLCLKKRFSCLSYFRQAKLYLLILCGISICTLYLAYKYGILALTVMRYSDTRDQWRKRNIFQGPKSLFPIFSLRREMLFPVEFSLLVDPKQISVVSKSKKYCPCSANPCTWQLHEKDTLIWKFVTYSYTRNV